jgi:hypothetical protein
MARARNAKPSGKAKAESKRKVGRPSEFKPEFCEQAEKLCKLGATDEELAEFFGVTTTTIDNWKVKHPAFLGAVKEGKVLADINVANSLYKKATGYVLETERVIGKGDNARVVPLKIAIEADTTAAIFWLKNRRKAHWRDKQDVDLNVYNHEEALDELE